MTKYLPYLCILVCGAAICFVVMKGCNGSQYQVLKDSLQLEIQRNDTVVAAKEMLSKKNDSVILAHAKETSGYQHKIDSLTKITQRLQLSFSHTRDTLLALHNRLDSAFAAHDTIAIVKNCDSLNNELITANNLLFAIQISRDSTDYTKDRHILQLMATIGELQGEISQFKSLLVQCTDNASNLSKTAQKAIKKNKLNALLAKAGAVLSAVLTVVAIVK